MTMHTIETGEERLGAAAFGLSRWLSLAACPTFAIMALVTGTLGDSDQPMLCAAMPGGSPFGGMVWMYALMSGFHLAPWLKLVASRR